jgi:hypothetical protein
MFNFQEDGNGFVPSRKPVRFQLEFISKDVFDGPSTDSLLCSDWLVNVKVITDILKIKTSKLLAQDITVTVMSTSPQWISTR